MTKAHHDHDRPDAPETTGEDADRRIEGAADEIFSRAHDVVSDVADRATHLAQDTLERGRDDIRRVDLSTRAGQPNGGGLRGASAVDDRACRRCHGLRHRNPDPWRRA